MPSYSSRLAATRRKCLHQARRWITRYELGNAWRPIVPILGVGLVLLVLLSYVVSIRELIAASWCCEEAATSCNEKECGWIHFHDFLVIYFGTMILFHYCSAVFRSPGVVLSVNTREPRWIPAVGEAALERRRVALYANFGETAYFKRDNSSFDDKFDNDMHETNGVVYIPSPKASFCSKCQHSRPPRCRHCSTCRRCVLQYDHHCIWVNQCIGYNNYRNFLMILVYISAGCWYGISLLFNLFAEPLCDQIQQQGLFAYIKMHYLERYGMLVPPQELMKMLSGNGNVSPTAFVNLVFPLLLGVGAVLTVFLSSHLKMCCKGRTTLEHRMICQHRTVNPFRQQTRTPFDESVVVNPFDQGSAMANLKQSLGHNPLYWFLPIPVDPPPPYLPPAVSCQR